ncbi:MAG: hypothetical protein INR72_08220 [Williamsia herbipolensis]|uniref:Uncharacterized protein n=1 Tax=Williamsia serinedens TaxID=391736 RepID=A0ABT1H296_9NOCA|nr:hypothetical protein [Williamsia serinedens]MBE7161218.1 hypothetical protein [Williamsia herbipolensis]MCP2161369.1 hypothetical protein [Williamsia serinedens]
MRIKKIVVGTLAAGGIGLASLGAGAGIASAAPTHQVTQQQQQQQWQQQRPTSQPGAVKRPDHRAFTYRGQRVQPQYSAAHHGWGFWFFGFWVPVVTR